MVWSVQPEAVLASAAAESAISAETEAAAAGAAPALLSTTPMGVIPTPRCSPQRSTRAVPATWVSLPNTPVSAACSRVSRASRRACT